MDNAKIIKPAPTTEESDAIIEQLISLQIKMMNYGYDKAQGHLVKALNAYIKSK